VVYQAAQVLDQVQSKTSFALVHLHDKQIFKIMEKGDKVARLIRLHCRQWPMWLKLCAYDQVFVFCCVSSSTQ
jgi:hypothetical protein